MIHFKLELLDSESHFVAFVLGFLDYIIDFVPIQLICNRVIDDEDSAVDLEMCQITINVINMNFK